MPEVETLATVEDCIYGNSRRRIPNVLGGQDYRLVGDQGSIYLNDAPAYKADTQHGSYRVQPPEDKGQQRQECRWLMEARDVWKQLPVKVREAFFTRDMVQRAEGIGVGWDGCALPQSHGGTSPNDRPMLL